VPDLEVLMLACDVQTRVCHRIVPAYVCGGEELPRCVPPLQFVRHPQPNQSCSTPKQSNTIHRMPTIKDMAADTTINQNMTL